MDVPDSVGLASSAQTSKSSNDTTDRINKADKCLPSRSERERIHGRIKTYVGWTGPVSPVQLAVAGFEFTGERDLVICVVCDLKFNNWKEDMKPLDVHRQFSPNCSFLKRWYPVNGSKEKTEVWRSGYESSNAKHQLFVEFVKRVASFTSWPHKGRGQSPQNMGIAGFFYLGSFERVECFYCGLVLRDWDQDDNPVSVHKQWSPNCAYIQHISQGGKVKNESPYVNDAVTSSLSASSMPLITTRALSPSTASAAVETTTAPSFVTTTRMPSASIIRTSKSAPILASATSASPLATRPSFRDFGSLASTLPSSFGSRTTKPTTQTPATSPPLRSRSSQNSLPEDSRGRRSSSIVEVSKSQSPMIQALLDWGYELNVIQQGMKRYRERTGDEVKNASELLRVLMED